LQPLAPVGGIAISDHVRGQLPEDLRSRFRSQGPQSLKNIQTPIELFTIEAGDLAEVSVEIPAAAAAAPARPRHRRLALAIAAGVLLLAAAIAGWQLSHKRGGAAVLDKSVAVLPFTNMSEDKGNTYFADGMQDEILTALSRIKALKVISRTSVERYRGQVHDLRAIAAALGVATVIEGGVQRAGNRVRINIQLIDANTDAHLWAESYDRDVSDLFAVQSEVARSVAQALQASLLPAEVRTLDTVPTKNTRAYDLFLQATNLSALNGGIPATAQLARAIALHEEALKEDPGFALAAAALSRVHMVLYWYAPDRTQTRLTAAKSSAERALALQPELGEGHLALAGYHYWGHRDYAAALKELELASRALPNNVEVVGMTAYIARRQGRLDAALAGLTRATILDPQNASWWSALGETYSMLRRYAEGDVSYGRAVAVAAQPGNNRIERGLLTGMWKGDLSVLQSAFAGMLPDSEDFRDNRFYFYLLQMWSRDYSAAVKALTDTPGDWLADQSNVPMPTVLFAAKAYRLQGDAARARKNYAEAQRLLEAALKERPDDPDLHVGLGFVYAGLGQRERAVAEGERAVALVPVSKDAVYGLTYLEHLAEIAVAAGEHDKALELLRQLLVMPNAGLQMSPGLLKLEPAWDPLRKDPRFQALLETG
jgi:TolB-like protein/Flp pilus assembly protein TadD